MMFGLSFLTCRRNARIIFILFAYHINFSGHASNTTDTNFNFNVGRSTRRSFCCSQPNTLYEALVLEASALSVDALGSWRLTNPKPVVLLGLRFSWMRRLAEWWVEWIVIELMWGNSKTLRPWSAFYKNRKEKIMSITNIFFNK